MNILRKTRKSKIKISKKRLVLLIFSLIMTTFAWAAYMKVLNTNTKMHINSWDISLYLDKNKNGVAETNEKITGNEGIFDIKFSDMYPGMNEEVVDVIIKNNGETPSTIDYILSDIAFLGLAYKIEGSEVEGVTNIIQKNEYVESAGIVTYDFIDEQEKFPFKIVIENTACVDGGAEGHLKVKALWQSSLESNDGLTQEEIDAKNESDTEWGFGVAEFVENNKESGIAPFQFRIKINATGQARSSRYALTRNVTPENYGDFIDYPIDLNGNGSTKDDWKIFFEGNENIYIIASEYVKNTNLPTGVMRNIADQDYATGFNIGALSSDTSIDQSTINKYLLSSARSSDNINYKATARLLNTSKWNQFVDSDYAESAVGAPTIEMLVKSWNQKFISTSACSKLKYIWEINKKGFSIANSEMENNASVTDVRGYGISKASVYFPEHNPDMGACAGYWIASPSIYSDKAVITVMEIGKIGYCEIEGDTLFGIRPVVMLKAGLKGESEFDEDTGIKVWSIEN